MEQLKANWGKKTAPQTDNTGFWDQFYPFYKMGFDESVTVRFLPDADEDNPLGFVLENVYHELLINGKKKKIACLAMHLGVEPKYGHTVCPLCAASKAHYDAGDIALGKAFWRKIDVLASVLVVNSTFDYPIKSDENPVRLVSLSTKLYDKVESAMASGEFDEAPYDFKDGTDFKITKTKQGEYADYSNSTFVRKSTAISAELLERIQLVDLKKFRFAKVEKEAMEAHMEAFLTGKTYESANEPAQTSQPSAPLLKTDVPTVSAVVETESEAATPVPVAPTTSSRAQALLERVKAQRAGK